VNESEANEEHYITYIAAHMRRKRIAAIIIILFNKFIKRNYRKKKKIYWISDFLSRRKIKSVYYTTIPILMKNHDLFENYCRLNKTIFEKLLILIAPKIKKSTLCREPISPEERLLVTLR